MNKFTVIRVILTVFILGLTAILNGCTHHIPSRESHWLPTDDKEFDSLLCKVDRQFNTYSPLDSINLTIHKMDSIAGLDNNNSTLKRSRALYWRACYMGRLWQRDSCRNLIHHALLLNDSVNHPYDRFRMKALLYLQSDSIDRETEYKFFRECLSYANKIGDKPFEASIAMLLGNTLNRIGEFPKALQYYHLSDSLNRMMGYHTIVIKNKLNIAILYNKLGNNHASDSILNDMLHNPAIQEDVYMNAIVNGNFYYTHKDSVKYLYEAYNKIKNDRKCHELLSVYSSSLSAHSLKIQQFDSANYYAAIAKANLPYVLEYEHKALIWYNLSLLNGHRGHLDSALICRDKYEMYVDSMHLQQRATDVVRLSLQNDMAINKARYEASVFKRNLILISVIVGFILLSIVVYLIFNRYNLKQKMKLIEKTLELDKTRKKMIATTLNMEEKDKILGTVKSGLSEIRQEKEISATDVKQLESTIKNHLLEHDNDEAFQEMFDVVNPGFKTRLRECCPNLAESYIQLACYTLMDLDNRKIARLMMIKPESVHQARWRLRQRLHIPTDQSLKDFLNNLNNI